MIKQLKSAIQKVNAKRELLKVIPTLHKDANGLNSDDLVDLILSEKWNRFFWMKQVPSEIKRLCSVVARKKPTIILEIGTAQGGSLFLFSKMAAENATIISIDLPSGKFGGGYEPYRASFYEGFAGRNQKIHLLRADSHRQETLELLQQILSGKKIDFLFIDGDHTYDGVKKDFLMYSALMDPAGIIALHDVALHGPKSQCKVDQLWTEIKSRHFSYEEIIQGQMQGWAGIGLINPPFEPLLRSF